VCDSGAQRCLVEPDLGVGQVVVVDQEEGRTPAPDESGKVGARAVDVQFLAPHPSKRAVDEVVPADGEAVAAQGRLLGGGILGERGSGDHAVGVDVELRSQGDDTCGLQPVRRPCVHVASARGAQLRE